jgi:AcrR family transcriptional regulator
MTDVKRNEDQPRRRAYQSPKRAQAALNTRRGIRAAAERLFLRDGYAPTTMVKIAAEAGVAEKTVYLAYPSKAALLSEIIKVRVRGDDAEVPVARRDSWTAMLQSDSTEQLLTRLASGSTELMTRAAAVLRLGEACAPSDPQLAELRDRGHSNIRADMREVVTELDRRGDLAPSLDAERATDILFAFVANESPYLRLIEECNWTPDEFTQLIRTFASSLLTTPPVTETRAADRSRPGGKS